LVQDITKGRAFHDCLDDAKAMAEIGQSKQAIIVAHVNETKLRALMRTDEALKALNVEVLGALLITE
jgi:Mrp family chromosome partitioning ATPase